MTSLNCNGFINYFGPQRFGNIPLSTPHIGLAMLQEDSVSICKYILVIYYSFSGKGSQVISSTY